MNNDQKKYTIQGWVIQFIFSAHYTSVHVSNTKENILLLLSRGEKENRVQIPLIHLIFYIFVSAFNQNPDSITCCHCFNILFKVWAMDTIGYRRSDDIAVHIHTIKQFKNTKLPCKKLYFHCNCKVTLLHT